LNPYPASIVDVVKVVLPSMVSIFLLIGAVDLLGAGILGCHL
jgi:hypothetical protein